MKTDFGRFMHTENLMIECVLDRHNGYLRYQFSFERLSRLYEVYALRPGVMDQYLSIN